MTKIRYNSPRNDVGFVSIEERAIRVDGRLPAPGWIGILTTLVVIASLIFGAKYVFDDLGWKLEGRNQGKAAIALLAVLITPGFLVHAILGALFAPRVRLHLPLTAVRATPDHDTWLLDVAAGADRPALQLRLFPQREGQRAELSALIERLRTQPADPAGRD